jgi:putative membrane protein
MKLLVRTMLFLSCLGAFSIIAPCVLRAMVPAEPVSQSDEEFITKAVIGGLAEVEMGKLAKQRASSPNVRKFAGRMVADHEKANQELEKIAGRQGVAVPAALDDEHKGKLDDLKKESGEAFDRSYIRMQVAGHEKMQALLEDEVRGTRDGALKTFAEKTLPTVKEHHRVAESLQKKMTAPHDSAAN